MQAHKESHTSFKISDISNFDSYKLEFDIQMPNTCTLSPAVGNSHFKVHLYRKLSGIPVYFSNAKEFKGIVADKTVEHHSKIKFEKLEYWWENYIKKHFGQASTNGIGLELTRSKVTGKEPTIYRGRPRQPRRQSKELLWSETFLVKGNDPKHLYFRDNTK